MAARFDGFMILAGMRTGSNLLEQTLNAVPGLQCHGEVFNPVFIGHQGQQGLFGIGMEDRAADPMRLWRRMVERTEGLPGFRFFHDHDPRILAALLPDPRIAKVILTRNPVDSHVSRLIAEQTGQWKLTHVAHRKTGRVTFDADRFAADLAAQQAHLAALLRGLQTTGQTAFCLTYDDLADPEVLTGLAAYLGVVHPVAVAGPLKRQNPEPLAAKVANFAEMSRALAERDRLDLHLHPLLEPRRGPAVPGWVGGLRLPLLFMPLRGADTARVTGWMAAAEGCAPADLPTGLSQKDLRGWMRAHPRFRSFAVLAHPLDRAHRALADLAAEDPGSEMRQALAKGYRLDLPAPGTADPAAWRAAMTAFLAFLRANLDGQTGLRTRPGWASQTALLQGMAAVVPPSATLHESELATALPALAGGGAGLPALAPPRGATAIPPMAALHLPAMDKAARSIWPRDYLHFGFSDWQPAAAG